MTNDGTEFCLDLSFNLHRRREDELAKHPKENNDPELIAMREEVERINKILGESTGNPELHDQMTDKERIITEREDKILGEEFCLQYYKEKDQLENESGEELKRRMESMKAS